MEEKEGNDMNIPQNTKLFLGIDPDTRNQAFAAMNLDGVIETAWVFKSKNSSEFEQAKAHLENKPLDHFFAIIEGQQIYRDDKKSNPADLLKLSRSSGMAALWCAAQQNCLGMHVALPREWKGTAAKHAKQAQILMALGQTPIVKGKGNHRYCIPADDFLGLNMTEYKHVIDAIGMAMWARDLFLWQNKKKRSSLNYKGNL